MYSGLWCSAVSWGAEEEIWRGDWGCGGGGEERGRRTMALLGEEEISLLGGGKIRNPVAGVEHGWSLVSGEGGVGTNCAALVVTEAAGGN